jgi:Tfp pilus assembly ATPase PilU
MQLMDDSLLDLYRQGRIDKEVALEHAFDKKALLLRMGGGAPE